MKTYIKNNKKGVLFVLFGIGLLTMMLVFNENNKNQPLMVNKVKYESLVKVSSTNSPIELTKEQVVDNIIKENEQIITFFINTFKIEKEVFIKQLIKDYETFELNQEEDFTKSLINYLFDLEKTNKKLFNSKVIPCNNSKEYMIALIKYFTKLYPSVDFKIAAGIAEIESGYSSKYMLSKNNIFGGMSGNGLIKYKNIEYGILKYIKLLNDGYFTKGLDTVEAIGIKYNPTVDKSGNKIAKTEWVKNVNNATKKYNDYEYVDINTLINLKNQ